MRNFRLLLVAFFAMVGMSAFAMDKPVPKASALATDGTTAQYFYNVDAGGFLIGANNYGTRASIDPDKGYLCRFEANGETFKLADKIGNNWNDLDCQNVDQIWVDGTGRGGAGKWTYKLNEDGSFTISNTNVAGFLSVVPSKNDTRLYMSGEAEAQSTWIAVSEEDYAAWKESFTEIVEYDNTIDKKFTSIAELDGQLFSIFNEAEEKAIFNRDNQNLAYESFANAVKGTSYLFKLESLADNADEEVRSCYTLQVVKADGSDIGLWGSSKIYLNSGTCAEGGFNGCFVLGNGDKFGTDLKYGGIWEIEYEEGKGFALKNKAHGGYFVGVNPGPTGSDPVYWTFGKFTVNSSSFIIPVGSTALDAYKKALADAQAVDKTTMFADDRAALENALDKYAYAKVINESATAESIAAATEALIAATNPAPKVFPQFNAQGYLFNLASGLIINSNAELKDKVNVDKEKDLFTVWQKGTEAYNAAKVRIAAGKNTDGTWASLRINADGDIVCFDENYSRWDVEVADGGSYYIKSTYTNEANSNRPGYLRANTETGKLETVATADEYCMWQFLSWEEYDALTTSIASVVKKAPAKTIFNAAGQRINTLQRGLNIVDGKKVLVK